MLAVKAASMKFFRILSFLIDIGNFLLTNNLCELWYKMTDDSKSISLQNVLFAQNSLKSNHVIIACVSCVWQWAMFSFSNVDRWCELADWFWATLLGKCPQSCTNLVVQIKFFFSNYFAILIAFFVDICRSALFRSFLY